MRMTKAKKVAIIDKVINYTLKDRRMELLFKERELGQKVYEVMYDEDTRKLMKSLPSGFLPYRTSIYYRVNHNDLSLTPLEPAQPAKFQDVGYGVQFELIETEYPELCKLWSDVEDMKRSINRDTHILKSKLRDLLKPVNTYKQAVEAWPSGKKYFDQEFNTPTSTQNLPAVQPKEVDELITTLRGEVEDGN